jgi:phosphatidylserine/phosphatidylglycerophosphate/cardiolipin synthase-like enzyme
MNPSDSVALIRRRFLHASWPFGMGLALVIGCRAEARQLSSEPCPRFGSGSEPVEVCFSPGGSCAERIISVLDGARKEVLVQAYSFTAERIADALIRASRRGVRVAVVLDRSNDRDEHSRERQVVTGGLEVWLDERHPIAHNKVIVADGETVVTGSYNFTHQAERGNAENLLVLHDRSLAAKYAANWEAHRSHSRRAPKLVDR